jgi:hypothetical protein
MRDRGTWIALFALLVVVVVLVLVSHPGSTASSPDHRSTSDAANGTSALRLYAEALGHRTETVGARFEIPQDAGLLFLFTPDRPVTSAEADTLRSWVQAGGVLVYANEGPDPNLERAMGLTRAPSPVLAKEDAAAPVLAGVHHLAGGAVAVPFRLEPQQVALVRTTGHAVLGLMAQVGQGRFVALADPLPLCNGYLESADNGRFAADLLGMTSGAVAFDEYHHAAAGTGETDWLTTPWGAALAWAAFVLFIGLAFRGRAFGPRIPLQPTTDRSTAEYASAIGSLLRRSGARAVTLNLLAAGARRVLAERLGLGKNVQDARFPEMLSRRAPEVAAQLARTESRIPTAVTDRDLLEVSRELHELAFPPKPPSSTNKKESP